MPASGCVKPHHNWPNANARLTAARPRPVWVLMLPTNRPIDWRAPIVSAKVPAAASNTSSSGRFASSFILGILWLIGQHGHAAIEQRVQGHDRVVAQLLV